MGVYSSVALKEGVTELQFINVALGYEHTQDDIDMYHLVYELFRNGPSVKDGREQQWLECERFDLWKSHPFYCYLDKQIKNFHYDHGLDGYVGSSDDKELIKAFVVAAGWPHTVIPLIEEISWV